MSGWRTTVTMECDDCQEVVYQTLANERSTVIGTRNRVTLPDQMVRHECPPAVPVGVQPAASSYFDTLRSMTNDPEVLAAADRVEAEVGVQPEPAEECAVHVLPNPNCNTCQPAVPVVHPEPGDRQQKWMRTWDGGPRACAAEAAREVAAAVAAVRADLAAEVAARVGYGPTEEFRSGYDQAIRWAAATIRGRS